MKYLNHFGAVSALAMTAVATLIVSCGGSDDATPAATATTIDTAGVTKGIAAVSALIPVCSSPSAAALASSPTSTAVRKSVWLAKKFALSPSPARSIKALGSTPPADMLGSCGGRLTFPTSSYSHLSGVTTATLTFDNYCTVNTSTNERALVNGSIAFVDTGTPGASGPIRSKIEANSPAGVTIVTQDATGKQLDSDVISFTKFLYTVGIPNGVPTASNPDRFSVDELKVTNSAGKVYRETGYNVTMFTTDSGGQQFAVSGRGYRTGGEYFDVTTSTPVVLDSTGKPVGGAMTFTGANGSTAVATLLPGNVFQAKMTVNGTPLAGLPACK